MQLGRFYQLLRSGSEISSNSMTFLLNVSPPTTQVKNVDEYVNEMLYDYQKLFTEVIRVPRTTD